LVERRTHGGRREGANANTNNKKQVGSGAWGKTLH